MLSTKTKDLKLIIVIVLGICVYWANNAHATTWYVRDAGGTSSQCTGTTNAVYPGSGSAQPCAFNHPAWALGASGGTTKMVGGDTLYIAGDSDNTWNFTVSGVTKLPAVGDEYTTNGTTYTVTVSMPVGVTSGQIAMTGPAAPPSSGTLTVVSGHGSGTSPITYTAKSVAKAEYMIGYGMPNNNCNSSSARDCVLNEVPEGISSSAETRILGLVGSDGIMPQLWGTEGADQILNLNGGGNYDVENLEITQHSSCSGATLGLSINYGIYPASCGTGGGEHGNYPYGPSAAASTWADFGITMIGTNFTTKNLWVHNVAYSVVDWEGNVSNWNSTNDRWIASGMSLTSNEDGTMSFGGTNSMTNDIWAFGGCQEKYPLPDPGNVKDLNNYINCADQGYSASYGTASQALGGGFMMQNATNGACGNWNVYGSQFLFNLKTNWDFLHCDGTGQVNVYRSRFEGSTGESFKASVGGVNLEEDQFIANAPVWETPQFQALKAPAYNSTSWDFMICRGSANVDGTASANETWNFVNDDLFTNCAANIEVDNSVFNFNSCSGDTLNVYNSKIINGYDEVDGGKPTNSALNGCTSTGAPFTVLKNTDIYNDNHSAANGYPNVCTSSNGNLCATDPLVLAEASPNSFSTMFGCNPSNCSSPTSYYSGTNLGDLLYLQSSSPLRNAGTTSGVTYTNGSSNDYNNFAVTDISPKVDVGALQYNSCITNSTGITNGFCSISDQCCGGSCNSEGQCGAGGSTSKPVVSITSPSNGSSVSAGSNISITATASETSGTITNIAIYNGSTLLGSKSTSPYTYVMTDPADGTYTLTAVATDANGVSTTSSPVTVTVVSQSITPSSPVVTITGPTSGSSYTLGSNVTITATASETNGTISNIALYDGLGILLGSSNKSPYNYVYTDILAGVYVFYAVATDANGVSTTSASISITVTTPNIVPSITTQPVNQTVTAGATATFSVAATGTPAPDYMWYQETPGATSFTAISGAGSASYTTPATTAANNGTKYACLVYNIVGNVTSSVATLTVTPPNAAPSITTQPVNVTVSAGATATFSVAATGTPAPSYRWYQEAPGATSFTAISGATSSSYTTPVTTTANSGTKYECVVTNASGSVTSNAATLTVGAAPIITTQPVNVTVSAGATATFSVAATGTPAPSYRWYQEAPGATSFTAISGATSSSYTTPVTTTANSGTKYECVVTNASGSVTSNAATLTVGAAPIITTQPVNVTVSAGATATFSVAATGTPAPDYIWYQEAPGATSFTAISGASSASYTTPATTAASNGTKYACLVYNTAGNVTSSVVTLTVTTSIAPSITTQPVNVTVSAGATATFSVAATGTPAPDYIWYQEAPGATSFTAISGAGSASYTTPATTAANNGTKYACLVYNIVGNVTSSVATLTVTPPNAAPSITTQPVNVTVSAGATATFSVAATGTPAPSYRWYQEAPGATSFTAISGATSSSYTTPVTTTANSGTKYECVVTNASGSVTSNAATLTVGAAPIITTQPVNVTVSAGATATFSVAATGTPAPDYIWYQEAPGATSFTAISGASSASYTTPATTAASNGTKYACLVYNTAGNVTSSVVTLTVTTSIAPSITTQPVNVTVSAGATATFSVAATGTPAPDYIWYQEAPGATSFTAISGAGSASYTTPATTAASNGTKYACLVYNTAGNVTSSVVTLTVNAAPSITTQPVNVTVSAGATATFSVAATGTPAPYFLWYQEAPGATSFTAISGAGSASYTTPATTAASNGTKYACLVYNTAGNVTSSVVTLTVNAAPSITTQPVSQTVNTGATATFSVAATGTPAPYYQWYQEAPGATSFTYINGAEGSSYTTPATTAANSGTKYECEVYNIAGNVISNTAVLTVSVKIVLL